jgi:uncharacterized RDD family membrane protein YckC
MPSALNGIGSDNALQEHWIKRALAIVIDCVIIYIAASVIMWFVWFPFTSFNWSATMQWGAVYPALSGVLLFLYSFIMESAGGNATIGKRFMDLRVIPITGEMDAGKAAVRNISKIHGLFLLLDWLVGFVSDGDPKQRWLDRAAGTTVVLTTALTPEQQHIYQSQQAKVAPPPQEPYQQHTRHEASYQYPPAQERAEAKQPAETKDAAAPAAAACPSCGGRMAETGDGHVKCIRCGKGQ